MAQQTHVSLTEAARNVTLKRSLKQYIKSCQCPDGTDSKTGSGAGSNRRPRRLFPNLAGFCYWMECGMSAFRELQLTYPDEADMILCAMEDQALNAYYLKVTVLIAYLRNRLGYDSIPKQRSASRGRNSNRQCKIELYTAADWEALCNSQNTDNPATHAPGPLPEPPNNDSSPPTPRQAPRPSLSTRHAKHPTSGAYRIRGRTFKLPTSAPPPVRHPVSYSRPPPLREPWSLTTE